MPSVSDLDLRLLKVFLAIVRAGSFAGAQVLLNISQSTVSNHMAALEGRLGYRLCHRGRVGFDLTEKGRQIYEEAQRLFSAIHSFEVAASSLKAELSGELKLGLGDNIVTDPLSPVLGALRRFAARKHSAFIDMRIQAPQVLQQSVIDGQMHAAVGSFPRAVSGLNHQHLYDEPNSLYCGKGHPLFDQSADRDNLKDMRQYRIVTRSFWNLEDIYRLGYTTAAARVEDMECMLILILSGDYIGFLPDHYAKRWVKQKQLRPVLKNKVLHFLRFDLITRKGVPPSPVLDRFLEDLTTEQEALSKSSADKEEGQK
jgi:DNA-binding transcriptional LysR family regulator